MERKNRCQQEQIYELKEGLAHAQADFKVKSSQFEGMQLLFMKDEHSD